MGQVHKTIHKQEDSACLLYLVSCLFSLSHSDAAGDTLCPGRQASYSCSSIDSHIWTGSAFTGMCPGTRPVPNALLLRERDRRVNDVLECGIFNATVTNITTVVAVQVIFSDLTFTPTTTLPTNGSTVICQDGAQQRTFEAHTINIQGEVSVLISVV